MTELEKRELTIWQQWRDHPERLWLRNATFQIHFWVGAIVGVYVFLMSVSGSLLVYDTVYAKMFPVRWLVDFHTNLLAGPAGRVVNGIGALSLLLLCLTGVVIWWPGIRHWRRSLTVNWGAHFPRLNWDLHSALGFWFFGFVVVWGLSAGYFVFPQQFEALLLLDPDSSFIVQALFWLSQLHFGRFGWFTRAVWLFVGLVPAVLAFTGVFICCRRLIYGKPSNPKNATDYDVKLIHHPRFWWMRRYEAALQAESEQLSVAFPARRSTRDSAIASPNGIRRSCHERFSQLAAARDPRLCHFFGGRRRARLRRLC